MARQGHPALNHPLTLVQYTQFGHVLASPGGSLSGIVDKALAEAGVSRRVVMAVPYFFAVLATVAQNRSAGHPAATGGTVPRQGFRAVHRGATGARSGPFRCR